MSFLNLPHWSPGLNYVGMNLVIWKETFFKYPKCFSFSFPFFGALTCTNVWGSHSNSTPAKYLCQFGADTSPQSRAIFRLANTPWPTQIRSCPRCLLPPTEARRLLDVISETVSVSSQHFFPPGDHWGTCTLGAGQLIMLMDINSSNKLGR